MLDVYRQMQREAVEELERKWFRAAIMDAMKVCADKSRAMSK